MNENHLVMFRALEPWSRWSQCSAVNTCFLAHLVWTHFCCDLELGVGTFRVNVAGDFVMSRELLQDICVVARKHVEAQKELLAAVKSGAVDMSNYRHVPLGVSWNCGLHVLEGTSSIAFQLTGGYMPDLWPVKGAYYFIKRLAALGCIMDVRGGEDWGFTIPNTTDPEKAKEMMATLAARLSMHKQDRVANAGLALDFDFDEMAERNEQMTDEAIARETEADVEHEAPLVRGVPFRRVPCRSGRPFLDTDRITFGSCGTPIEAGLTASATPKEEPKEEKEEPATPKEEPPELPPLGDSTDSEKESESEPRPPAKRSKSMNKMQHREADLTAKGSGSGPQAGLTAAGPQAGLTAAGAQAGQAGQPGAQVFPVVLL